FAATARSRTLAEAAQRLGVDATTVSRRLRSLQADLGVTLFERVRGGLALASVGERCLEAAHEVEESIRSLERAVMQTDDSLRGEVRISLPQLLALTWAEQLHGLTRGYPELSVLLVESETMHNLSRREADIAIRADANPPGHLVGRRVGTVEAAVYGTPEIAFDDWSHVPWIGWTDARESRSPTGRARAALGATGPYAIRVGSYATFLRCIYAGLGVALLPCVMADADERLRRCSEPVLALPLWILTHPELHTVPRVRVVMRRLVDFVSAQQEALAGRGGCE
ncbi:MAG: LysR family transcriptional regulator, partial [Myxococcota bacterium]